MATSINTLVTSILPRAKAGLAVVALVSASLFVTPEAGARKSTSATTTATSTTDATALATPADPLAPDPSKVSADLVAVVTAATTPWTNWARDIDGVRHVKAIIVAVPSADPDLASLRATVIAAGGSVYFRYTSVAALSVLLPAASVAAVAQSAEVQSISPNRLIARMGAVTPSALELTTGVTAVRTRSPSTAAGYAGYDGSGVGIAILDSGIMYKHKLFTNAGGASRVRKGVSFLRVGDATAAGVKDWTPGIDASAALYPGSASMADFESRIATGGFPVTDPYGHGTHVASVAAGRDLVQGIDTTGMAPGADLFDVGVLDANGFGQLSDVLAGIDWVIYHAKEYNIRVMNLSLSADSTESWQIDPLARAARSAVAAGITVVAAAGNFGLNSYGQETFGTVGSPGHDPSVITVGAVNMHGSTIRADDTVNFFSSRGPTRGAYVDATGVRRADNLLKPDLVAPGNKLVAARAVDNVSMFLPSLLPLKYPQLTNLPGTSLRGGESVMMLSGTSVAAPVVAGAAAVLLQANPGLTPPLIKAILQYTAQPLPGASLVQQGAGLINMEGAVRLALALRTDVATAVQAGTLVANGSLLATGKSMPAPVSLIEGESVNWSQLIFAGGSHIVSGSALFRNYQPIYDPRVTWVRDQVRLRAITYWPADTKNGVPANTYPKRFVDSAPRNLALLGGGILSASKLAGPTSMLGGTGAFLPTWMLSSWIAAGSGVVISEGICISEGIVISEGIAISEGVVISEGIALSEGIVISEGIALSEGIAISEAGQPNPSNPDDRNLLGEP